MLKILEQKASVPFVPRQRLQTIADVRSSSKTPPGFKDPGDGDFFIWADFLFGLRMAQHHGESFKHALLITNDEKTDWSRQGNAHPILVAEARRFLDVEFQTWNVDKLSDKVLAILQERSDSHDE